MCKEGVCLNQKTLNPKPESQQTLYNTVNGSNPVENLSNREPLGTGVRRREGLELVVGGKDDVDGSGSKTLLYGVVLSDSALGSSRGNTRLGVKSYKFGLKICRTRRPI